MKEPAYILKKEITGINGERIILFYFTTESVHSKRCYGVGIDMYTQNAGARTIKVRKVMENIFEDKRKAEEFLRTICRCSVTATSLEDVVSDNILAEKNII